MTECPDRPQTSDGGMFPGGRGRGWWSAGKGLFTFSPGHCGPGGVKLARGVANIVNPETEAQSSRY